MTSGTYSTLQGDVSPSPPKSYRLSKLAKIALALISCGAVVAIAPPRHAQAMTNFRMEKIGSDLGAGSWGDSRSGGAAPADSSSAPLQDQVEDLEVRVAAIEKYLLAKGSIEKYLQAAGGSGGGSGNSRKQYHGVNGVFYNADYGW